MDHRTWAVYTRISDDRTSWLGIARQLLAADEHLLAAGVPQDRIRHYTENHTSAWKVRGAGAGGSPSDDAPGPRVFRRQWTRLQRDARAGLVEAVLVPHLDRLVRDVRDLEDAISLVDATGVTFSSTTGDVDLCSREGRDRARLFAWHAAESSADMSRRAAESHRRSAAAGRHVGGPRPFGWLDDRMTLHPQESVHLRRWVEVVLGGSTWRAVVADSRGRGVTGTRGALLNPASVRQIVLNPRNCGLRMFGGQLLTDDDGLLVRGEWDTVCSELEHFALVGMRGEHPRLRAGQGTTGAQHPYLLNGLARCGRCGSELLVVPREWVGVDGSVTVLDSYACPAPDNGGCAGVARNARKVDAHVLAVVQGLARAGAVDAAWTDREHRQAELVTEVEGLEEHRAQRLRELARSPSAALLLVHELDELDRRCRWLMDQVEACLEHRRRTADPAALCFGGPEWEATDLVDRRQRLRDALDVVVVHTCTAAGTSFDEAAVEVRLRPWT